MGEVSRTQELRKLKGEVLKKVSFLEHKAVIDYREVYTLIRFFFKKYLGREYEFTIRELRLELQSTYVPVSVREEVFGLLDTIEHMEYAAIHYSREELTSVLALFRKVVEELVRTITRKKSFWAHIKSFVIKEEEEPIIISELPVIEENDYEYVHMNLLLERLYLFINKKDERKARKQYQQVLEYYDALSDSFRQEFYPLVDQAFHDLQPIVHKKKK